MPFESTPGSATANSYASVAEADTYFSTHRESAQWTALSTTDKEKYLIESTMAVDDRVVDWIGTVASVDQSLDWPRSGLSSSHGIESTEIPDDIKRAVYELSMYLLEGNALDDDVKLDSVRTGTLRVDFDENNPRGAFPRHVSAILTKYGLTSSSGGVGQVSVIRT